MQLKMFPRPAFTNIVYIGENATMNTKWLSFSESINANTEPILDCVQHQKAQLKENCTCRQVVKWYKTGMIFTDQ